MAETFALILNIANLAFVIISLILSAVNCGQVKGDAIALSICALATFLTIIWVEHLRKLGIERVTKMMPPPPDENDISLLNLPQNNAGHILATNRYEKKKVSWETQHQEDIQNAYKKHIGLETILFVIGIGFTLAVAFNFMLGH